MNFQASKVAFARCHLLMGSWQEALDAAQVVLNEDKRNIKSIYVKAEALFNLCEFEHSLVLFHRGLVSISLAKNQSYSQKNCNADLNTLWCYFTVAGEYIFGKKPYSQ